MSFQTNEQSLVVAAMNGSNEAVARLLLSHSSELADRLHVRLRMNPFVDFTVDDVLQEIYLDVYRGMSTFRPRNKDSFKVWLNQVADNRLASMIRTRGRLKRGGRPNATFFDCGQSATGGPRSVSQLSDSGGETGSENFLRKETAQQLRDALGHLPSGQRDALKHHYLEQKSLDSTAQEMQKTVGAVRGLLHRAKKTMRDAMGSSSRWFRVK